MDVDADEFRRRRRGGAGRTGRRGARDGRPRPVRRGAAARGPLRAVDRGRRARRCARSHLDLLRLAGRWEELLEEEPADEEAHLALAARPCRPGRPAGRAAPARAAGRRRCAGSSGRRRAPQAEQLRARLRPTGRRCRRRAAPSRGSGWSAAASVGRPDPRAARRAAGAAAAAPLRVHRPAGRRQDRAARPRRGAGARRGLADRPRHGLGGRGAVAVRAGARGAGRPVPPAPGAARRARRRLPRRDRPRAVRAATSTWTGESRPPAALRRGRRAGPAGRRRPRAAAGGGRRPGGRRGVAAAAALPGPLCGQRGRSSSRWPQRAACPDPTEALAEPAPTRDPDGRIEVAPLPDAGGPAARSRTAFPSSPTGRRSSRSCGQRRAAVRRARAGARHAPG